MANCSTSVLMLSLVIVSSLHNSLSSNPMQAAIKSRHCVARGFVMKVKVICIFLVIIAFLYFNIYALIGLARKTPTS